MLDAIAVHNGRMSIRCCVRDCSKVTLDPMRAALPLVLMTVAACGSGSARVDTHSSSSATRAVTSAAPAPSSGRSTPTENPPDADVAVATGVLGHRVMRGQHGKCVLVDSNGAPVLPLGRIDGAAFDPTGKLLYAWSDSLGVLYDVVAAKKLAERETGPIEGAVFSRKGNRIIEMGQGIRFVSVPALVDTNQIMGGHSEVHQATGRGFTVRHEALPTGIVAYETRLLFIDLDKEKTIGTVKVHVTTTGDEHPIDVRFSSDGKSVTIWNGDEREAVAIDVATGTRVPMPKDFTPPERRGDAK